MAPAAADIRRMLAACDNKAATPHEVAFYAAHAGKLRAIAAQLQHLDPAGGVDAAAKSLAALQGTLSQLTRWKLPCMLTVLPLLPVSFTDPSDGSDVC